MTSTEEETLSATAKMAESEPEKLVEVNVENNEDGSNRPEPEAREEVAIDIDDFVQRKFRSLGAEREVNNTLRESLSGIPIQVLKIQKAPLVLIQLTSLGKCFEPRVMSIGPLRDKKTEELKHGEKLKGKLAKHFINSSGQRAEDLHAPIYKKVGDLKKWYDEKEIMKPYDDQKELSWLLFVDGCALLQYIRCHVEETFHLLELDIEAYYINLGLQDLFMLENQLPFLVLRSLMDESKLQLLICQFIMKVVEYDLVSEMGPETPQVEDVNHLLEFLWRAFRPTVLSEPAMAAANEVSFREQLSAKRRVIRKEAGIDFQDDYETLSIVVEKNDSTSFSCTPYKEWLKKEERMEHK